MAKQWGIVALGVLGVVFGAFAVAAAQDSLDFRGTDHNRDGLISPSEYANYVIQIYFFLDRNADFQWTRAEYAQVFPRQSPLVTRERQRHFEAQDRDGDGVLTIDEVEVAIRDGFISRDKDRNLILTRDELSAPRGGRAP